MVQLREAKKLSIGGAQHTWYTHTAAATLASLRSSESGLSMGEAARRLAQDGQNILPEKKTDGLWVIFLEQFRSPLIYVLLGASGIVFLLGEPVDASIILFILFFNAVVGTVQEGRARNTLAALRHYVNTTATVMRDGQEVVIPDRDVVVGDVLVLREGDKIPADARIMSAQGLSLDEASLTGESVPIQKIVEPIMTSALPAPEQRNMVFRGTHITSGQGRAVVCAVGPQTIIGQIATEIASIDSEIPLKANIRQLSRAIIVVVAVIAAALCILGLARGEELVTIFSTVVSLSVSIIPEGLPIVITLVLATGVWRMSKRNALVKRLQAVEALGQARVIAVDKTGTITKNELVIREVWTDEKIFTLGGVGYEPKGSVEYGGTTVDAANHPELLFAGKVAALASNAHVSFSEKENRWQVTGDPTEAAVRIFGEKIGFVQEDILHESPRISELPFDYRLKYHATAYADKKGQLLVVDGAPEAILRACTKIRRKGRNQPLRASDTQALEAELTRMSSRGLRVVALAMSSGPKGALTPESIAKLTFVALVGMQDVLRPEVASAMARAKAAGIKVVMITGDHKLTACAIAKEAGIWSEGDHILTGVEIDALSDTELAQKLARTSVFARVTPEHKLRIITAYKKRGEIVAMTGDGVNDAPPLVAADLGVAMGNIGTEVAKEAADIVLLDDNFGSIVAAVEEGRSIYRTIQKVILYLFSTSLGEVLVITAALILGYPLPILAVQILWLNFVTDGFLDVSLAMEPKEEGLLSEKFARPKKHLVDGAMLRRMLLMALPMVCGTLFLFVQYVEADIQKAWTMSLTTLAVFQWFNAWNCRSSTKSVFQMSFFSNKYLIGATTIVVVLQVLAVYTAPLQHILRTVPLSLAEWVMILPVAASILVVEEVRKALYRARHTPTSV